MIITVSNALANCLLLVMLIQFMTLSVYLCMPYIVFNLMELFSFVNLLISVFGNTSFIFARNIIVRFPNFTTHVSHRRL
jgi:hypothetical protein